MQTEWWVSGSDTESWWLDFVAFEQNTLYYGDCLDWMEKWDDSCVDLIYLDPPFNSKVNYNIIYGKNGAGDAQYRAFTDIWHWDDEAAARFEMFAGAVSRPAHDVIVGLHRFLGECGMLAYLTYMAERLEQMRRLLKPTGSIYLHCDPTASHYLKSLMDAIFGHKNFRNEITWKRFNFHADARRFGAISDRILFYSKGDHYLFNRVRIPYSRDYIDSKFTHIDSDGRRYRLDNLNPPGNRGPVYEFHGITKAWRFKEERMRTLDAKGLIYIGSRVPQIKRYLAKRLLISGKTSHRSTLKPKSVLAIRLRSL